MKELLKPSKFKLPIQVQKIWNNSQQRSKTEELTFELYGTWEIYEEPFSERW